MAYHLITTRSTKAQSLGFHVYNLAHVLVTVFDGQQITHPGTLKGGHLV